MAVKASVILVIYKNEKREERRWDAIPMKEKHAISECITGKFMDAAGYSAADKRRGKAEEMQ